MELRSFIKQAITDIVGGVMDAQDALPHDCVIPVVSDNFESVRTGISELQGVNFEVKVRADQTRGSEAKLSVLSVIAGGSVKGESAEESGHSATLQFKVPIRFLRKDERK